MTFAVFVNDNEKRMQCVFIGHVHRTINIVNIVKWNSVEEKGRIFGFSRGWFRFVDTVLVKDCVALSSASDIIAGNYALDRLFKSGILLPSYGLGLAVKPFDQFLMD